jgi:hypothetical protein
MRVMVKFTIPNEGGNEALKDGRIGKMLPQLMEDLKPEAAYFYPHNGLRAGHFVISMTDSSQIVEVAERVWFALRGSVELVPVMNGEDIQKGLPSVPGIVAKYA